MKIYRANILDTPYFGSLRILEQGYVGVEAGRVVFCEKSLPASYAGESVEELGDVLLIPGFVDLHVHAPQWCNAGVGFSLELLPWLEKYTFPAEARFADLAFAGEEYQRFVDTLLEHGTTRAAVFGTRHMESTKLLMQFLSKAGLCAFVGKVNMDRNAIPALQEETKTSLEETKKLLSWLSGQEELKKQISYIVTPRYVPCTTPGLMRGLAQLAAEYALPVQSHLDENRSEVEWVRQLHPECKSFADVYNTYGLLPAGKSIMAHCIHMTDEELALLRRKQVWVAHCAMSNADLSSGIMPLRRYLRAGLRVAIASDMGGSHSVNMREHIVATIQASKLYWCIHPEEEPVSFAEAFYLATKAGGSFFGRVGAFLEGYDFDALVIDDSSLKSGISHTLWERLERFVYLGDSSCIRRRFCQGREIGGRKG